MPGNLRYAIRRRPHRQGQARSALVGDRGTARIEGSYSKLPETNHETHEEQKMRRPQTDASSALVRQLPVLPRVRGRHRGRAQHVSGTNADATAGSGDAV